ncbi:MAG: DUF1801 domain-containing protein [Ignavibacteriales bacterium]|nr:DUF1801 domain-containing protein [Ignavibacteriales bacterium]MCB9258337.1 DUF1801 domain-containing protein [Ignavibacteriales bacterium]
MKKLKIISNPDVKEKFKKYPKHIRPKINHLRKLILDVANFDESITEIEETLKWSEPSYITKNGSTLRIDWKLKNPDQYAMYFKCTSKLVPTFKEVFGDLFKYENTRAILFDLDEKIPEDELKICISLTLNYHKVKNLPKLGL